VSICICAAGDFSESITLCQECNFPKQVLFYCKNCRSRTVFDVDIAQGLLTTIGKKVVVHAGMIVVQSSCHECHGGEATILEIYGMPGDQLSAMREKLQQTT